MTDDAVTEVLAGIGLTPADLDPALLKVVAGHITRAGGVNAPQTAGVAEPTGHELLTAAFRADLGDRPRADPIAEMRELHDRDPGTFARTHGERGALVLALADGLLQAEAAATLEELPDDQDHHH